MKKTDFLEAFDELLHDYIAECDADGEYEDVSDSKTISHIDGHDYEISVKVKRL